MKVFCVFIKKRITDKFGVHVDVFRSRKKKLVYLLLKKPLPSYVFFDGLILFMKNESEKSQRFFENYEVIYPRLVHLLKWRFDYVFFQLKEKKHGC